LQDLIANPDPGHAPLLEEWLGASAGRFDCKGRTSEPSAVICEQKTLVSKHEGWAGVLGE